MASVIGLGMLTVIITATVATSPQGTAQPSPALARVRTICVETFEGDPALTGTAKEIAIAGLFAAKKFTITERCDKADAVLKGAIMERSATRVRAEGEGAGFGVAAGGASTTAAAIGAAAGGSEEALYSKDTQLHASVAARLVDSDGTVMWAHTQESPGGKVRGAIVDAVERALRQLVKDIERAESRSKGES